MSDELGEPRDPNYIWLRQSVTFTVNGQTRSVEMALPLRPGATPSEVEALLDEADAGMRRLSRRLDAHLAELAAPATAASAPAERPSASQPAPAMPRPTTPAAARQPGPAATPPPTQRPVERPAAAPVSAPTGPDLTIPQFIAQAAAIGFNQHQAMEKLGVRSLSGLNLREALESLRRQAVLDGASPAPASPAPANPAPPLAFEEEEDEEELFAEERAPASPPPSALANAPDLNTLKRDTRLTPASKLPAPAARRSGPLSQDTGIAETPAEPITPAPLPEETPAQKAERMLAELRATPSDGAASKHQRDAFANIVVSELSEKGATALTTSIWNIPPAKLGPEQLDALISWGKRDHFKDEAREVLIAAKRIGAPPAASPEPPAEPAPPPARSARSTRARPSSQPEEPRGGR